MSTIPADHFQLQLPQSLPGDSTEYELLSHAAQLAPPGLICELGTRLGGGIQAIVSGLALNRFPKGRTIISVDPYGGIPFKHGNTTNYNVYDNNVLTVALATIPVYCHSKGIHWIPFVLEDTEFFDRFSDGVPVYNDFPGHKNKLVLNSYALVHIDAQHTHKAVNAALDFFQGRIKSKGFIVFDDIQIVDPPHRRLTNLNFSMLAQGQRKAVYRKD